MRDMRFCSFCGKALALKTLDDGSEEKYCGACDHVFFETPSPAVLVLVTNSDSVLLARGVGWKHPYWGLISGHIRTGSTAEETAVREVREEVGLEVSNLKLVRTYAARDRRLLMLAFRAEAEKTSITKSQELEDAQWFSLSEPLPMRSESMSACFIKHVFENVAYRIKKLT